MTVKCEDFMRALQQLCSEYDVQLAPSCGFSDGLVLWDKDYSEPFHCFSSVTDMTGDYE